MGKFFVGQFNNNLDEQRRILVPSKFNLNEEKLVLIRGFENCLYLYTVESFSELNDRIKLLSFTKSSNREFQRMFLSGAYEVSVDSKGRIAIPEDLAIHAGMNKECVFIGTGSYIEIWDKGEWRKYYESHSSSLVKLAEEVDL